MGLIYNWRATNPAILGHASPLIREPRFVRLAVSGGTLDGLKMTKLLKGFRVRMRRVEGEGRRARLAVGRERDVGRIERGAEYV